MYLKFISGLRITSVLGFLLTVAFLSSQQANASTTAREIREGAQQQIAKEEAKRAAHEQRAAGEAQKWVIMPNEVNYSYNFDADSRNFYPGHMVYKLKTNSWLVLVNVHGPAELNLSSSYQPGMRTLSWAIPYQLALGLESINRPHDDLALPTEWSGERLRKYVSFMIIPPGKQIIVKAGFATPQTGKLLEGRLTEERPGGGLQFRMKNIPEGTIVLRQNILTTREGMSYGGKGEAKIDLHKAFLNALKEFPERNALPQNIADRDFSISNPYDFEEILEKACDVLHKGEVGVRSSRQ